MIHIFGASKARPKKVIKYIIENLLNSDLCHGNISYETAKAAYFKL